MSQAASEKFVQKINEAWPGARILLAIPVGWRGWELDDEAAVITTGGEPFLVSTDHGSACRADSSLLAERLAEYEEWAKVTRKGMDLLGDRRDEGGDAK